MSWQSFFLSQMFFVVDIIIGYPLVEWAYLVVVGLRVVGGGDWASWTAQVAAAPAQQCHFPELRTMLHKRIFFGFCKWPSQTKERGLIVHVPKRFRFRCVTPIKSPQSSIFRVRWACSTRATTVYRLLPCRSWVPEDLESTGKCRLVGMKPVLSSFGNLLKLWIPQVYLVAKRCYGRRYYTATVVIEQRRGRRTTIPDQFCPNLIDPISRMSPDFEEVIGTMCVVF